MPITHKLHVLMILLVLFIVASAYIVGRWARKRHFEDRAAGVLGWAVLMIWIAYNIYYFMPSVFKWSVSLPLQICDFLAPVTFLALVLNKRRARAILYFCALPFAGQVILTPVGNQDPAVLRFWFFWLFHAGLLASSFFDFSIRGFRPCAGDLMTAFVFDITYVLLILPVDIITGWDYGYIGNSLPGSATLLSFAGPWPFRVLVLLGVSFSFQTLMFFFPKLMKRKF